VGFFPTFLSISYVGHCSHISLSFICGSLLPPFRVFPLWAIVPTFPLLSCGSLSPPFLPASHLLYLWVLSPHFPLFTSWVLVRNFSYLFPFPLSFHILSASSPLAFYYILYVRRFLPRLSLISLCVFVSSFPVAISIQCSLGLCPHVSLFHSPSHFMPYALFKSYLKVRAFPVHILVSTSLFLNFMSCPGISSLSLIPSAIPSNFPD
jgi:hypothetical protein